MMRAKFDLNDEDTIMIWIEYYLKGFRTLAYGEISEISVRKKSARSIIKQKLFRKAYSNVQIVSTCARKRGRNVLYLSLSYID